jgi:hypothetical protein
MSRRLLVLALAVPMLAACSITPEGACDQASCVEQASEIGEPAERQLTAPAGALQDRSATGAAHSLTEEEQARLRPGRRWQ